jgi:hypothetical protein
VRFFGGWDFDAKDRRDAEPARVGYAKGVPMGGDSARRDGQGADVPRRRAQGSDRRNLDRIQVVKGWVDAQGRGRRSTTSVWVGDRKPARTASAAVGDTSTSRTRRGPTRSAPPSSSTSWKDPDFDPKPRAFYYVRVIEIPTPRWTAYDAKYSGVAACRRRFAYGHAGVGWAARTRRRSWLHPMKPARSRAARSFPPPSAPSCSAPYPALKPDRTAAPPRNIRRHDTGGS